MNYALSHGSAGLVCPHHPKREHPMSSFTLPDRRIILGGAALAAFVFIAVLTYLFKDNAAGVILLDSKTDFFPYPLTIQNVMHLIFFLGLGELLVRWLTARREHAFLRRRYLPEDEETVLQVHDLGPIRRKVARDFDGEHGFLPSLIDLCILQFQSTRSVDQAVSVLNSNLELIAHRVDLRYSMLRYISWVIPTFGFIGTVVGIALALARVDPEALDLKAVTQALAVAFNTTIIALVLSAILVLGLHVVQQAEELSVNRAGHYTLRNLINRLYTGQS
jgi:biopolymer transport protein ExbB/TolQ